MSYEDDGAPAVKDMTLFMQKAKKKGFYEPGWSLEDYVRNAPIMYRWECFPIWGIKGSYKSNRLMWLLFLVYGNWKLVHKYMVMQPLEFTELLKEKGRIPMIGWDDIAAWFDSQLYFENRSLYTRIKRCWTLMRTSLNVFAATIPRKDELPGFILRDINAEMFCSPAMTYDYDRWTWRKHYKDPQKVVKKPISICENKTFNIYDVPTEEFEIYWERRMVLANIAKSDMVSILEEAFEDPPEPTPEELSEEARILSLAGKIQANRRWKNKR